MAQALEIQLANANKRVREQQKWIEEHGRTQAGYVARYGSWRDPGHYGDGGEAIFQADYNALINALDRRDEIADKILRRMRREGDFGRAHARRLAFHRFITR